MQTEPGKLFIIRNAGNIVPLGGAPVLVQLENLKMLAIVAEKIEKEGLSLHGWVYKIETGEIFNSASKID